MINNILLQSFNTPFESFPFKSVKSEDYLPAILELLEKAKEDLNIIINNPHTPTFENTIVTLERNGQQLNRVVEAFFNLDSAETNEVIQNASQEVAPILASFSNDIVLNDTLFQRIQLVYHQKDNLNLNAEQERLLNKTYKSFIRNGALLNEAQKNEIRDIDEKLSTLKIQFQQNLLQETNDYTLELNNEEDIKGLPTSLLEMSKKTTAVGKEIYAFNLQYPSYVPFMKYAANRTRREELYIAYNTRGYKNNEYANDQIIKDIIKLKHQRANILGYQDAATFTLEERMAKSPANVLNFLNELLVKAKPFAEKEIQSLQGLAKELDGVEVLMPYDHAYYAEKLREKNFNYSEETVKEYFTLEATLEAAFDLARKLFQLEFTKIENVDTYHEDVTVYNVLENGEHKALLYTDFHPRKGKRAGAWMTSFKGQYNDGTNHRPHISIVCNFTAPTHDTPSLLTFNEVTTLFHEFGHALHGILANTEFESLSGTNVFWDFVELPSQFLENYCYEAEFLATFAKHWKTGEILPQSEIEKIVASANFMEGYQTVRQVSFGLLDIAYYTQSSIETNRLETFEKEAIAATQLYPVIDGLCFSTSFAHIFGGGYASGYYSYKWAEVLDADAFEYFKENGIFNPQIASKYKDLLSSGGTIDPEILYKNFRGRAPKNDALLKRAGLL